MQRDHFMPSEEIFRPFFLSFSDSDLQFLINKYEKLCRDFRLQMHISDSLLTPVDKECPLGGGFSHNDTYQIWVQDHLHILTRNLFTYHWSFQSQLYTQTTPSPPIVSPSFRMSLEESHDYLI